MPHNPQSEPEVEYIPPKEPTSRGRGLALITPKVDGRSAFLVRQKKLAKRILADIPHPSTKEQELALRAATLLMALEDAEANLASGTKVDLGQYTTAANAFRRLLEDIHIRVKDRQAIDDEINKLKMRFEFNRDTPEDKARRADIAKSMAADVLARSRSLSSFRKR